MVLFVAPLSLKFQNTGSIEVLALLYYTYYPYN